MAILTTSPASAADLRFIGKPGKVVINQSYENVSWSLAGPDVGRVDMVSVTLEHAGTRSMADFDATFDGVTSGRLRIYDYERPGRYRLQGAVMTWDYDELPVAPGYLLVKYDTRSSLSATRSGRFVTLRAVTKKYTGSYPLWANHRNAAVRYQRYAAGAWRTFAKRTVARNGVTQVTFRRAKAARYRVVAAATPRFWDDVSRTVRR